MIKRYAPPVPHPSYHRANDGPYYHELLRAAGLSQRAAGPMLGLKERSVRNRIANDSWTYPEQYMLEVLADAKLREESGGVHDSAPTYGDEESAPTIWYRAADRPLQRHDVGKVIVGEDQFGVRIVGEAALDGFGLVVKASEGVDVRKIPVERIEQYALLDPPLSNIGENRG